MLRFLVLLSLIVSTTTTTTITNKFGIGCYDDTPNSPPIKTQLEAAKLLVGNKGFVTLYLCSWRHENSSCMNTTTTTASTHDLEKLQTAYAQNLTVIARIGNPYVVRDHSDDDDFMSYKQLANAYSRYVRSLPLPPDGVSPLYVTIGNEFNACNEWRCSSPSSSSSSTSTTTNMTTEQMALEVAAFSRDVALSLISLRAASNGRLLYAHGALASWETSPCECGTGASLGQGRFGLHFLSLMLERQSTLYTPFMVDWLSSHSYPFSQAPWGDHQGKAKSGLEYYLNETLLIERSRKNVEKEEEKEKEEDVEEEKEANMTGMKVIITETGWNLKTTSNINRSNWTLLAWEKIWNNDDNVIGVTPL